MAAAADKEMVMAAAGVPGIAATPKSQQQQSQQHVDGSSSSSSRAAVFAAAAAFAAAAWLISGHLDAGFSRTARHDTVVSALQLQQLLHEVGETRDTTRGWDIAERGREGRGCKMCSRFPSQGGVV